ncbi:hypothetical protein [Micromonospora sp. NPDC051141]|uniref:hypothetical protein n=1 Tax=Micromonospora sp. NPDC051141 TaxID=3364284 RepID=UPI0037B351E0
MTAFRVAISTDDDETAGAIQLLIRVEASGDVHRIAEITMRSNGPAGLTVSSLPEIDLEAIGQALIAGAGASRAGSSAVGTGAATGVVDSSAPAGGRVSTRGRSDTQQSVDDSADHGRLAAVQPAEAARHQGAGSGRAYRRMPDAEEVRAVYEAIGTVTGVAEHYGVPRHTAKGWIGRLRKLNGESS